MNEHRFELNAGSAPGWVTGHGLNPQLVPLTATEVHEGVSASVVAVTGDGVRLVLKQALAQLRVPEVWEGRVERAGTEAAALRLLDSLTPGVVPRLLAYDADDQVIAMELLPADARNWQAEINEGVGRGWVRLGARAGAVLGKWHRSTTGRAEIAEAFGSIEVFEELRLVPFYEVVMQRRPELATLVGTCAEELRSVRECLVDGDYAPKNMLVTPEGDLWICDLEVAHYGNPVFDVGFFLSFALLSSIRWPRLRDELRAVVDAFLSAYDEATRGIISIAGESIASHTACLMLARTDGVSPAAFLDDRSLRAARELALSMLVSPQRGLWAWA